MTAPRAGPVVLALLGILVIAIAAATLNSAVAVDGGGLGTGDGPGPADGEFPGPNQTGLEPGSAPDEGSAPVSLPTVCVPLLTDPLFLLTVVAVAAGAGYLLYRRTGPLVPVFLAFALGPPAVLLHVFLTACGSDSDADGEFMPSGPPEANESLPEVVGNGSGVGGSGGITSPSLVLLAVLGAALVAAVALIFATSDDQSLEEEVDADPEARVAPEAIGRAAGRAADRIEEDADLDNEVYRAWHEMTKYLDVPNPEASTPGEFADAAVAAGMDRRDVSRLTGLFEEVRYGASSPTPERERRAVDALRRIEETYAEEEP